MHDPSATKKLTNIALDPASEPEFTVRDGVLHFQGRIWTGGDTQIQHHLIKSLHSSAARGHSGFHATYNRIKRLFAWKGLKKQVKDPVQSCMVCQQAKTERVSLAGLLQPLPIPKKPWSVVSLDFIEG